MPRRVKREPLVRPKVGSTFSGVGGIDLGFERAGMMVAWQSEIEPNACKVLAHHWPEAVNYGSVVYLNRKTTAEERSQWEAAESVVSAKNSTAEQKQAAMNALDDLIDLWDSRGPAGDLDEVDVLCGGFPCQDVSTAGKRKGFKGDRSSLFYEFARLARELQPEWIVIENVPGLLSSNEGKDFLVVLESLADCGYEDISWRILDSIGLHVEGTRGVPQRRRRLFVVGHLGAGTRSREVLLEPEGSPWSPPSRKSAGAEAPSSSGAGARKRRRRGAGDREDLENEEGQEAYVAASASTLQAAGDGRGYRVDAESAAGGHLIANGIQTGKGWWKEGEEAGGTLSARDWKDSTQLLAVAPDAAATLTSGQSNTPGVNNAGRRKEDDVNLVPVCITGERTHTLTAEGHDGSEDGTGRGQPMVAVPFRKSKRAQTDQDDETWVNDERSNTLNDFDVGDARAVELIVEPIITGTLMSDPITAEDHSMPVTGSNGNPGYVLPPEVEPVRAIDWQAGGHGDESFQGKSRQWIDTEDFSGALGTTKTKAIHHSVKHARVRRLTPLETTRLQAFPDDHYEGTGLSDSAVYKCNGNAVTVNAAHFIGERIMRVMRRDALAQDLGT